MSCTLQTPPSSMRSAYTRAFSLALLVGVTFASSTLAALTPIGDSPNEWNEPNLLGTNPFPGNPNPSVLQTLYGEQNVRRVDDSFDTVFTFTQDVATIRLMAKQATDQLKFGVDAAPTPSILLDVQRYFKGIRPPVLNPIRDFWRTHTITADKSNHAPQFRLQIWNQFSAEFSSDPSHNIEGSDQLVTFQVVSNIGFPDNPIGAYVLAWEDSHPLASFAPDRDFQDLVVEVTGIAPVVPEPSSVVLILLGVSAGLLTRLTDSEG
jgi:hypothetical protein